MSARVRSLLAACPSWRTRFSAPRMHLLAARALGAVWEQSCMHCLRRSDGDAAPPPPTSLRGRWSGASSRLRAWACAQTPRSRVRLNIMRAAMPLAVAGRAQPLRPKTVVTRRHRAPATRGTSTTCTALPAPGSPARWTPRSPAALSRRQRLRDQAAFAGKLSELSK